MSKHSRLALLPILLTLIGARCRETTSQPEPPDAAPRGPPSLAGPCTDESAVRCLSGYAKPKLGSSDLDRLYREGLPTCFALKDPDALERQGACLPTTLGIDQRNGKAVDVFYACGDLCPAYGRIMVSYRDVEQDKCCKTGGYPLRLPGWGNYGGCGPPEGPIEQTLRRLPDGGLVPTSPCDEAAGAVDGEHPAK